MFTFDVGTHIYRLDSGEIAPSITQVMAPLRDFSSVPPDVLQRSCEFGTNVHLMIELYCCDDLDEDSLDECLIGPLRAFNLWLADHGLDYKEFICEKRMVHPRLKFGGTPDIIIDGKLIVEIKTRKCDLMADCIQTAAQEELWTANGGQKVKYEHRVLELKQSGDYAYSKVNDPQAWGMFRALLDHYRTGQTIEAWRGRK